MNFKQIILSVLLSTSIAVNVILIQGRFEKHFYEKGVSDGARQLGDRLVAEVQKSQAINVKMPDGKQVTLATLEAFQKQIAARQAQRMPATSKPVKEPPIDAMKGTIDKPSAQEVNKP